MELDLKNLDRESLISIVCLIAVLFLIKVLYANTFRLTLKRIAPDNRFLKPNHAWLLLIPVFNIYWNFEIAKRMADSLTNEFYDRKVAEEEDPGRSVGMALAYIGVFTMFPFSQGVIIAVHLLYIGYFVYYWIKMNRFRELLKDHDLYLEERQNNKQ